MSQRSEEMVVAMTGASGAAYGLRLMERLARLGVTQHLLFSDAARVVLGQECDVELADHPQACAEQLAGRFGAGHGRLHCYALQDWFSPAASGSSGIGRMVVVPCSMGTLARIAAGLSGNLIERAADVMLKERRQLILVPRETPLSAIHLENMLRLSRMGAQLIPAMPGFYHRPESIDAVIDFVVDRIIDHLGIANPEAGRWGG